MNAALKATRRASRGLAWILAFALVGAAPAAWAMSVSLTSPSNGAVFVAPTNITLSATATPDWNYTISKVDFFYGTTLIGTATTSPYSITWTSPSPASYALTAKATEVKNGTTHTATSSVVNIVVDAPPVVSITSPAMYTTYNIPPPAITITATASDSDGTVSKVDFYWLAKSGGSPALIGTVTAPPYSVTWTPPAPYWYSGYKYEAYSISAIATDNLGATSYIGTSPNENTFIFLAPSISLTSPADGSRFSSPASINLTAALSPSDAPADAVDFYNGTTLIGEILSPPYAFAWQNVPAGTYSLTATVRIRTYPNSVTSSPITVTVDAAPSVSLGAPATGAVFAQGATIPLSATATDTPGTITKVDFYQGTTLIGTATASPYTFNWTGADRGTYTLTAVATNDAGGTATSNPVSVTVAAPPLIYGATPNGVTLPGGSMPEVGASYIGRGANIDTTKVTLQFDGQDVTSQAAVTETGVLYLVSRPLADATHTVSLSVADLVGDVSTDTWTFVTSDPAPNFYGETPRDVFVAVQNPRIRVLLSGFNIVPSSVSMSVDGADVTSQADAGVDHIIYTPSIALDVGVHTVDVSATDGNGVVGTKEWQFTIDIPPAPSTTDDGVRTDRTVVPQIRVLQ